MKQATSCILSIFFSITIFGQGLGESIDKKSSVEDHRIRIDSITELSGKKSNILVVDKSYRAWTAHNYGAKNLNLYVNGIWVDTLKPDHLHNFHFTVNNIDLNSNEKLIDILSESIKDGDSVKVLISENPRAENAAFNEKLLLDFVETKDKLARYLIVIAALIISFITVITLSKDKNKILRDSGVSKSGKLTPFSLARTQMAFWTVIVLISILYIWMYTGTLVELTSQVLILLGISAGTTVTAKLIDKGDLENPKIKIRHQDGDHDGNFFSNIVSDQNGLSIHRFQNVVFSLAIGLFFLYEVFKNHRIPELDENLMILMGISSGTYLAIKKGENSTYQDEEKAKVNLGEKMVDSAPASSEAPPAPPANEPPS